MLTPVFKKLCFLNQVIKGPDKMTSIPSFCNVTNLIVGLKAFGQNVLHLDKKCFDKNYIKIYMDKKYFSYNYINVFYVHCVYFCIFIF